MNIRELLNGRVLWYRATSRGVSNSCDKHANVTDPLTAFRRCQKREPGLEGIDRLWALLAAAAATARQEQHLAPVHRLHVQLRRGGMCSTVS